MFRFPQLQEAILLNRIDLGQLQVVLPEGGIQLIRSAFQKLGPVEVLGTRIWFSPAPGPWTHQHIWELAELDSGVLVCLNPASVRAAVHHALLHHQIPELVEYTPPQSEVLSQNFFMSGGKQPCMLAIEPVLHGDDIGRGFFPSAYDPTLEFRMRMLVQAQLSGQRAVLLLAVPHQGIKNVFLSEHIDPQLGALLIDAHQRGLQILCYRIEVTTAALALKEAIDLKVIQIYKDSPDAPNVLKSSGVPTPDVPNQPHGLTQNVTDGTKPADPEAPSAA
ncbi:MAG: DNA/RNA nuclease SfsA [Pseudomonadota bacterium]